MPDDVNRRPADYVRGLLDPDPFRRIRREMEDVFGDLGRMWPAGAAGTAGAGFMSPKVNIAETAAGLEISAELPGVKKEDVHLDMDQGVLTLRAEHREETEQKDEKKRFHVVERSHGAFLRRFPLPFEPEADKIAATFENGVLRIDVPRRAPLQPPGRKIEISGA